MCIAFWSLDHPTFSFIFAANRDEYFARRTESPRFRSLRSTSGTETDVLCGLDLEAGGTWLGLSSTGRFAMLTNYREATNDSVSDKAQGKRPSRGHLVRDVLVDGDAALDQLDLQDFTGFNLLHGRVGGREAAMQLDTNRPAGSTGRFRISATEALGSVSNGAYEELDKPSTERWVKVEKGSIAFRQVIDGVPTDLDLTQTDRVNELVQDLFDVLSTPSPDFDATQPQTVPQSVAVPPLSLPLPQADLYPAASHPAADAPKWYGTRTQTVVLVDRAGHALFVAREAWRLDETGQPVWSGRETGRWQLHIASKHA